MPMYKVDIQEESDTPSGPIRDNEPTPEVRSVRWCGEAADEEAAREAGYVEGWDQKYGSGRRPVDALVDVAEV